MCAPPARQEWRRTWSRLPRRETRAHTSKETRKRVSRADRTVPPTPCSSTPASRSERSFARNATRKKSCCRGGGREVRLSCLSYVQEFFMAIDRFEVFPAIHWVTAFGNRPSFSPDGQKIVFQRDMRDGSSLWIVNRDGSGLDRLYPPEGTLNAAASRPDWSWSDRIAFANHGEIWTI